MAKQKVKWKSDSVRLGGGGGGVQVGQISFGQDASASYTFVSLTKLYKFYCHFPRVLYFKFKHMMPLRLLASEPS